MRLFGFWEASTLCYGCMVCAVYVESQVICLPFQHFRSCSVQEICAVLVPFHFTVAKALVLFLQMMRAVCAERSKLMIIILVDDQNIDITSNNKYYQESTNHSLRMAATSQIIQSLAEAIVVDLCLILWTALEYCYRDLYIFLVGDILRRYYAKLCAYINKCTKNKCRTMSIKSYVTSWRTKLLFRYFHLVRFRLRMVFICRQNYIVAHPHG